jgi:two-component system, sensor histidine kinase
MTSSGPSLRRRLVAVTLGSSGVALLVACAAFLVLDALADHREATRDLETIAAIFAYGSAGSLEFDDRSGATEVLAGMRAEPEILRAGLYDREGKLFASYRGERAGQDPWSLPPADGLDFTAATVRITQAVELDGERVGSFVVEKSLQALYAGVAVDTAVVLGVLLLCCALVFAVGSRLVRGVTAPILELAGLAREITTTQDYARRATVPEGEEIGVLALTLNAMLDRIERDTDLRAQREQLKQINAALEREKDRALDAARAKSEFLANMSHEIRTPMTSILGYIDVIRSESLPRDEMNGLLEVVQRNGHHLLAVINDILDLSKLEAGRVQIEHVWCSPQALLAEAGQLMEVRASTKGLALEIECRGLLPRQIRSDPTRLRQILLNLLSNAVKFTSSGRVRAELRLRQGVDGSAPGLTFQISDTGIGIPTDKHESIFEAFSQADSSMTRRFGGSGLGLSISARLAGLLGGTLTLVRSQPGEGTTVELRVPLGAELTELEISETPSEPSRRIDSTSAAAAVQEPLHGRVLLAEDSPDTQRLVRMVLQRAGLSVDIAENGALACELARTARDIGEPYSIILMDMQMPVLDGYSAARALRDEGFTEPIIAFTAHAMSGERERCIAAGCDDYASKPIDRVALLRLVASYSKNRDGSTRGAGS